MKISKYTFLFRGNKGDCFIYNTLSNALIGINKDIYDKLTSYQQNKEELLNSDFDDDFYEILEDKHFITENDKDELLIYKSIIKEMRNANDTMHLTIAPTMDCNFSCHYCFEKEKTTTYMSNDVIDALVKHVASCKDLQKIHLTWFGGEPLMAIKQMKQMYKKLMQVWKNKDFVSDIITTAYFIDKKTIKILKDLRVTNMQITLDGMRETHNKVKFTDNCNDVFSKIIQNVDLLLDIYPELHITFRINLTKKNIHEYIPLYNFLLEHYNGKKIGIAPAFVIDRENKKANKSLFFKNDECSKIILSLMWRHNIHSPFLHYPQRLFSECAIRNINSTNIDPEGYVYKCWEIIGNKKYAIGKLDKSGNIVDINYTNLNRQLYGADPIDDKTCSQCAYLPLCNGGCPIHRIQNEFEGWHNNVCTPWKGFLPEFLLTHIALKKSGIENY